jgi:hypothetical protein
LEAIASPSIKEEERMSRAWKVGVGTLSGLALAFVGYIGGRSKVGELLVPNAAAQTTPANINLAKPSCVTLPYGAGVGLGGFACVADLDGNGKQEIVVGQSTITAGTTGGHWYVHIVDGTGTERGTGTLMQNAYP